MSKDILIIEDEPDVATYLATILRTNGYNPVMASDAKNGFLTAKKIRPALICLDIMMPQESGLSLYTKLKQEPATQQIPVMVISGVIQSDDFDFHSYIPDESIPLPDCFMEKPIDVEKFVKIINELTSSPQQAKKRSIHDC